MALGQDRELTCPTLGNMLECSCKSYWAFVQMDRHVSMNGPCFDFRVSKRRDPIIIIINHHHICTCCLLHSLVRMTVTHDEYPFDFMIPYNPKDWLLTGILESPPRGPVPFRPKVPFDLSQTHMIAICCEKVLCENRTEAAVRVAAVDRKLKVR